MSERRAHFDQGTHGHANTDKQAIGYTTRTGGPARVLRDRLDRQAETGAVHRQALQKEIKRQSAIWLHIKGCI
jgi:hypothetical protein